VLCLVGLSLAATMMTEQYALRGLVAAPGSLPVARLAGWLSEVTFVLTFAPMFFLVLLFPDGRLPSRRWRPVLWALFAVAAGWEAQQLQAGTTIRLADYWLFVYGSGGYSTRNRRQSLC
jgi:hypothetical protein